MEWDNGVWMAHGLGMRPYIDGSEKWRVWVEKLSDAFVKKK